MSDKCCCCRLITAAAIVGVLQLLIVVFEMSTSGLILNQWSEWKARWNAAEKNVMAAKSFQNDMILKKLQIYEKLSAEGANITAEDYKDLRTLMDEDMQMVSKMADNIKNINLMIKNGELNDTRKKMRMEVDEMEKEKKEEIINDVGQQMYHAHMIAFTAVWFLALLAYAAAFYYRRPAFVLPNFVMTIVALIVLFVLIVNMILMVIYEKKEKDDEDNKLREMLRMKDVDDDIYEMMKAVFVGMLVWAIVMFLVLIGFIVIIHKFHKWLLLSHGFMIFPEGIPSISHPMKPGTPAFE